MHHDVLLANGGEAVAVEFADALGKANSEGLENEVGALRNDQLGGIGQPQHALLHEHPVVANGELAHDETLQARRHPSVDLEADHVAAAAALQRRFVEGNQVFCFFLDFDVAVAQHAERPLAARDETRKQARDEHADRGFDADEADRRHAFLRTCCIGGEPDEANELARDRQQGMHRLVVALAPQLDADGKPPVLNEREGMCRIDGDRREDRQVTGEKFPIQPRALGRHQLLRFDDDDAHRGHLVLQRRPARLLVIDQDGRETVDLRELLGRGQAVLALLHHVGGDLTVKSGRAHHVELVEVGGGDRQEAQPLKERVAQVLRLLQYPAVELQPGKLAIVVAGRSAKAAMPMCWHRPPAASPAISTASWAT